MSVVSSPRFLGALYGTTLPRSICLVEGSLFQ